MTMAWRLMLTCWGLTQGSQWDLGCGTSGKNLGQVSQAALKSLPCYSEGSRVREAPQEPDWEQQRLKWS